MLSIVCVLVVCGTCCSGKEGEYGPEEFYEKPFGGIGYGAKYHFKDTDTLTMALFAGVPLSIVFLIASSVFNSISQNGGKIKPSYERSSNETEERVNCKKCNALVLRQTAERTNGLCKPCYKKNRN